MTVETAATTISLILAPAVMLTACRILVAAMLQPYSAINDRAGSEPTAGPAPNKEATERLVEIDHQLWPATYTAATNT